MRLRFRLRTLMILVAVVAVGLGARSALKRFKNYRSEERFWSIQEAIDDYNLDLLRTEPFSNPPREPNESVARQLRRHRQYAARMRMKYHRAAARLWMSLPPDEPEPELSMDTPEE